MHIKKYGVFKLTVSVTEALSGDSRESFPSFFLLHKGRKNCFNSTKFLLSDKQKLQSTVANQPANRISGKIILKKPPN